MNLKTLAIVVALLAAAAGGAFLLRSKPAETAADPRAGKPLIEPAALADATSFKITGENNAVVTLKRTEPGAWVVEEYHGLPVDFEKLTRLTRDLEKAKVARFVTRNPERVSRLELDKTSLSVGDAWTLAIGRNAEGGGRFVRFGKEDSVYQTDFDAWVDTTARNWASQDLAKFQAAEVRSVKVEFPGGASASFARETREGTFAPAAGVVPDGFEFKRSTLDNLLSSLGSLRFTDTTETGAENAVAAREHAVTYTIEFFNGTSTTIAVGRKPAPPANVEAAAASTPADGSQPPTTPPPSVPETPAPQPGPVFAFVRSSDAAASVNAMMEKRAFTVGDWVFSQLPADAAAFFEAKPAPAETPSAPSTAAVPAEPPALPISVATPPIEVPPPPPAAEPAKRVEAVSPIYSVPAPAPEPTPAPAPVKN